MYNRAKELYCDATTFCFWFFTVYLPKKMETEKSPKAAESPNYSKCSITKCTEAFKNKVRPLQKDVLVSDMATFQS